MVDGEDTWCAVLTCRVSGDALRGVVTVPDVSIEPEATAWTVVFPADAVDPAGVAPLVSWRNHPLLSPFVGARREGAQRLPVPAADRVAWSAQLAALADELGGRQEGYADAARAGSVTATRGTSCAASAKEHGVPPAQLATGLSCRDAWGYVGADVPVSSTVRS